MKATDGAGNEGPWTSTSLTIDITPPAGVPALSSPASGSTLSWLPTLDWSDIADLSGVSYSLVVDDNNNFSSPVLNISGIISSTYTISSNLAATISYHWRVRAVDGAGNIGGFSLPGSFMLSKTATSTALGVGWNMIALPLSPDPATASNQFDEIVPLLLIYHYNTGGKAYIPVDTLSIGQGYWIKARVPASLLIPPP